MPAWSYTFAPVSLANVAGTECAGFYLPYFIARLSSLVISPCRFADISSWFGQCPAGDSEFHIAVANFAGAGDIATKSLWPFEWNPGWIFPEFFAVGPMDFTFIL
jgi:hypothetical protein